jgi:hypothetical protein
MGPWEKMLNQTAAGYASPRAPLMLVAAIVVVLVPGAGGVVAADTMYHYYEGGGTKVHGPNLLVRKGFADRVSLYAGYYQDDVSSASIDVVTTASPYKDKRNEYTVGADFLYQNSLINLSFSNSEESDYTSDFINLGVAHEVFGGMTTISLGYSQGNDDIQKNGDPTFGEEAKTYRYRLGVSQVLTKTLIGSVNYEGVSQDGYLNNPYRFARVQNVFVPEVYPRARNGYALAVRLVKGLAIENDKLKSSIGGSYRYYDDTWGINAHEVQVNYHHYFRRDLVAEFRGRYYTQQGAAFYADNFATEQRFMSRDKELSTFQSWSVGARTTLELFRSEERNSRGTITFDYEHLTNSYDDFSDVRTGRNYSFNADVIQVIFSWMY